ncbi:LamG domain-containing protein [Haloferula sargassicola]|uniref:LamG-like jellyroll fold domain-containing protein n=1 Tax=Haloferula sargassicola TaxID=490096 RepID=A0ABP9UNL7_9BACT
MKPSPGCSLTALVPVLLALWAIPAKASSYADAVLADGPLVFLPLGGAIPQSVAVNSGSLGAVLDGTHAGVGYRDFGALDAGTSTAISYADGALTTVPFHAALNPPAGESFTIEAWVRPDVNGATNAQAPLFNRRSAGNRQGWAFFQRSSTTGWNFRMYDENGGTPSIDITGGSYFIGAWSHLAVVWDGPASTATLYVDGVNVGSQSGGYVPNTEVPLGLGAYSSDNAGDNPFTGGLDEVAFYPAALTSQQINAHIDNAWTLTPEQSYATLVESDGAILHLRLDEYPPSRVVAGNLGSLGVAGNGIHFPGAIHGVAGALAGDDNPAMRYDMIDPVSTDGGYPTVLPAEEALNSESFSWEGWVRPLAEGNPNAQALVKNHEPNGDRTGWVIWQRGSNAATSPGSGYGWNLRLYNGSGNNATINLVSGNGAGGYVVGEWQHLAVTYNASTQTALIYVNGAQVATQTTTAGPYVPNGPGDVPIGLAGFPNGTENPFKGDLDEVAFYDTVLSTQQIADHHANGINASRPVPYHELIEADGPVAYYRLDEPEVAAAENLGSLGADGQGVYVNDPLPIAAPELPVFDVGQMASLFDGDKTYVELRNPEELNIAGEITLEAWVRPDPTQVQTSANIIGHGGNDNFDKELYLRIEEGNYEVGASGGKASFAIPAEDLSGDAWVHLAGTWSGGEWMLYRNGELVATGEDPDGAVAVDNANWSIGSRGRWKYGTLFPDAVDPGQLRVFSGGISSAAIYDTALSASRIEAHFAGSGGAVPQLMLSRPAGSVTLEWTEGVLQESGDLGSWSDVPGAVSPYLPDDGPIHFYRLRY